MNYILTLLLIGLILLFILSGLGCQLNNLQFLCMKESFENKNGSNSALPKGIPKNEIPNGDEDMYIKKSEVVPPVCPKCPDISVEKDGSHKCPPCPPCGRCPEPNFECKKVPNYSNVQGDEFPRPVLTDFSQFGM
jgi:hypothetical protein